MAVPALSLARRNRIRRAARKETLLAHDGPESRAEAYAELGFLPPDEDPPVEVPEARDALSA